jgi:hypothetical protein
MKHQLESCFYETKDHRKYELYYNSEEKVAWAVELLQYGRGRSGPELQADSQEDTRQKLIKAIESGSYLNKP